MVMIKDGKKTFFWYRARLSAMDICVCVRWQCWCWAGVVVVE